MSSKISIAVLYGGKSAEHEVSIQSAKNVVKALDPGRYEVTLVAIGKDGRWHLDSKEHFFLEQASTGSFDLSTLEEVAFFPGNARGKLINRKGEERSPAIDVVFPVLHGTCGEDGTVQGLLRICEIPFVGPDVLGSAVGMDKEVAKRLLVQAGMPVVKYETLTASKFSSTELDKIIARLGLPLFVKPANLGSSVGITKVRAKEDLEKAVRHAFEFDTKILVEQFAKGREIECSVLGNELIRASVPGEIIPIHEFYSYDAKYVDAEGAKLMIPAQLSPELIAKVKELAVRTAEVLCCEGMSRVDFFLTENGELLVNEINTIPGFTRISMYPKLWGADGLDYPQLVDRLVELALARAERQRGLKFSYQ